MTIYDAVMAIMLVGGMAWGAWRGISWQLASIASLFLGYSVGVPLSAQIAPNFPGDPLMARGLALLVCYAAVAGGVFFAAWLVRATLRRLKFEAFDHHLGMVLGGIEGILLGIIGTLFVASLAPNSREPIFSSNSGRIVGRILATVEPILPAEAGQVLKPFWEERAAVLADDAKPFQLPESVSVQIPIDGESLKEVGTKLGRALVDEAEQSIERVGRTDDRNSPRR